MRGIGLNWVMINRYLPYMIQVGWLDPDKRKIRLTGRTKKVYSITFEGEKYFEDLTALIAKEAN